MSYGCTSKRPWRGHDTQLSSHRWILDPTSTDGQNYPFFPFCFDPYFDRLYLTNTKTLSLTCFCMFLFLERISSAQKCSNSFHIHMHCIWGLNLDCESLELIPFRFVCFPPKSYYNKEEMLLWEIWKLHARTIAQALHLKILKNIIYLAFFVPHFNYHINVWTDPEHCRISPFVHWFQF